MQACNLGPKEKRKRVVAGIFSFAAGGGIAVYLTFKEIEPFLRLLVYPLFYFGILCFLQAKERTCVLLALRRRENFDGREVPLADSSAAPALIRKSQKMVLQAFFLALVLTLFCFFS